MYHSQAQDSQFGGVLLLVSSPNTPLDIYPPLAYKNQFREVEFDSDERNPDSEE